MPPAVVKMEGLRGAMGRRVGEVEEVGGWIVGGWSWDGYGGRTEVGMDESRERRREGKGRGREEKRTNPGEERPRELFVAAGIFEPCALAVTR